MAQFIWLGEQAIGRSWVKSYGPTTAIKVPNKDGSWQVVRNPSGFTEGEVIEQDGQPVDFTDERALRALRADPRYQEVI